MNRKQQVAALIGALLILLSGLIPPWKLSVEQNLSRTQIPFGYAFIFSPPEVEDEEEGEGVQKFLSIDVQRLVIQWVTVLFVMAVVIYVFQEKREKTEEEWEDEEMLL